MAPRPTCSFCGKKRQALLCDAEGCTLLTCFSCAGVKTAPEGDFFCRNHRSSAAGGNRADEAGPHPPGADTSPTDSAEKLAEKNNSGQDASALPPPHAAQGAHGHLTDDAARGTRADLHDALHPRDSRTDVQLAPEGRAHGAPEGLAHQQLAPEGRAHGAPEGPAHQQLGPDGLAQAAQALAVAAGTGLPSEPGLSPTPGGSSLPTTTTQPVGSTPMDLSSTTKRGNPFLCAFSPQPLFFGTL